MKADSERVRWHFDRTAANFDAIYTGQKAFPRRFLDRWLRWDMQERMRLTLEACQPIEGRSVLDVGCGTGRFCFPLAEMGAGKVVGVDFAAAMVDEANKLAHQKNLADRCSFHCTDISKYKADELFDYVIAIGLFDYVRDARHLLCELRERTRGKAVMTFPRADTWRAPVRKIRLMLMGCPVYFYTEKRIRDSLMIAGFVVQNMKKVGKLYFVEAT